MAQGVALAYVEENDLHGARTSPPLGERRHSGSGPGPDRERHPARPPSKPHSQEAQSDQATQSAHERSKKSGVSQPKGGPGR